MKLYGMTNCMKTLKAIEWLSANGITFKFLDIRKVDIDEDKILEWAEKVRFCTFLNKQIPTWTHLYPKEKMLALNEKYAIRLMWQKPALVKRPVVEYGEKLLFGLDEQSWEQKIRGDDHSTASGNECSAITEVF